MSFTQCLTQNDEKVKYNVSFGIVSADAFVPTPLPNPEGLLYSDGSVDSSIQTGTLNQVLTVQSVDGSLKPAWTNLSSIDDPLYVNDINERTPGLGVTIANSTIFTEDGILMKNDRFLTDPSTLFDTYLVSSDITGVPIVDSISSDTMGTVTLQFMKIGAQVTLNIGSFDSGSNQLSSDNSKLNIAYAVPAGFRPLGDALTYFPFYPFFANDDGVPVGDKYYVLAFNQSLNQFELQNIGNGAGGSGDPLHGLKQNGKKVRFQGSSITYIAV